MYNGEFDFTLLSRNGQELFPLYCWHLFFFTYGRGVRTAHHRGIPPTCRIWHASSWNVYAAPFLRVNLAMLATLLHLWRMERSLPITLGLGAQIDVVETHRSGINFHFADTVGPAQIASQEVYDGQPKPTAILLESINWFKTNPIWAN